MPQSPTQRKKCPYFQDPHKALNSDTAEFRPKAPNPKPKSANSKAVWVDTG